MKKFFPILFVLLLAASSAFADAGADAMFYNDRGCTYFEQGRYDEAHRDFNQAVELDPKNAAFHVNRGNTAEMLRRFQEAINDYHKAIELDPKQAAAYYHRARLYSVFGKDSHAIQDLTKAVKIHPDYLKDAKTESDFDNIRKTPEFKNLPANRLCPVQRSGLPRICGKRQYRAN